METNASEGRGLSRRTLLLGMGTGGFVAVAAGAQEGSAREPGEAMCGTLVRVVDATTAEVAAADGSGTVSVVVPPGATVLRDGPAALGDFVAGEKVTVRGSRLPNGGFSAVEWQALYEQVEASVQGRAAGRLATSAGELTVDAQTQTRFFDDGRRFRPVPVEAIKAGDGVVAMVRRDGRSGDALVRALGTREA